MGIGKDLKRVGRKLEIGGQMVVGIIPGAGQIYAGMKENQFAKDQAKALQSQAQQEIEMAQAEADTIRERARRFISQQRVALVDSGVRLDAGGSAEVIQNDTRFLAEQDALAAIQSGNYQAAARRAEAKLARQQGRAALIGGIMSGTGQMVQTAASVYAGK